MSGVTIKNERDTAIKLLHRALLGGEPVRLTPSTASLSQISVALYKSAEYADRRMPAFDPTKLGPKARSRIVTAAEFGESWYANLCSLTGEKPILHRKQWEWIAILQAILQVGGRRGVVFGVGTEPLPAALASLGCEILATDQLPTSQGADAWNATSQLCTAKDLLNSRKLCEAAQFDRLVSFRNVDMREVPRDLAGFDFCWSSCCFEHLGSLQAGLDFVRASLKLLRPGGVAVHTTEYNIGSAHSTVETPMLSLYRKRDLERFLAELRTEGHVVSPVDYRPGSTLLDKLVAPHSRDGEPHLKYKWGRYVTTSVLLLIQKSAASSHESGTLV